MLQTNRSTLNFYGPETAVQFREVKLQNRSNSNTLLIQKNFLIDHISDAVVFTDMDLRIIYINKKAEQVYGIRSKEVTGHLFKEIIQYVPFLQFPAWNRQ